jgi:hypothetical protein
MKKITTFLVYFVSTWTVLYTLMHLGLSIFVYLYKVNDIILQTDRLFFIGTGIISFVISLLFLKLTKFYRKSVVSLKLVKNPPSLMLQGGHTILINIEVMRKIIYSLYQKINFNFTLDRRFFIFIADLSLAVIILLFSILIWTFLNQTYYTTLVNLFLFTNGFTIGNISPKLFLLLFILGILISMWFHELMHIIGLKFSSRRVNGEIEFVSSGIGIALFTPVAYVLTMTKDGKEFTEKEMLFSGPFANALLAIIFYILAFATNNALFYILGVVNSLLFMTNVFPLLFMVDGGHLSREFQVEQKYYFFTNPISSFFFLVISYVFSAMYYDNVLLRNLFLALALITAISFIVGQLRVNYSFLFRRIKKISIKKELVDSIFYHMKYTFLIEPKNEKDVVIDYKNYIIRTPNIQISKEGGYIVVYDSSLFKALNTLIIVGLILSLVVLFTFKQSELFWVLMISLVIIPQVILESQEKRIVLESLIADIYKKLYLKRCMKIFN